MQNNNNQPEEKSLTRLTDLTSDELRGQLRTLEYEIASLRQDKEVTALRHAEELRDVQKQAEAEIRRIQVSPFQ